MSEELMAALQRQLHQPKWLVRIPDSVAAIAWSPDGSQLAGASLGGPIYLFDRATGDVVGELPGHEMGTLAMGWAAGGLATAGQDGAVRLWNPPAREPRATMQAGPGWADHIAWNPAGTQLLAAAGRRLTLWGADGALLREFERQPSTITGVLWHPETPDVVACGLREGARLFRTGETKAFKELPSPAPVLALAWSRSGRFLAAGCHDGAVRFWDLRSGEMFQMRGYPVKVRSLSWSADSRFLVTSGALEVAQWDFAGNGPAGKGAELYTLHADVVNVVAHAPRGYRFASGGREGIVAFWESGLTRPLKVAMVPSEVRALAWSPDGRWVAAGFDDGATGVWPAP